MSLAVMPENLMTDHAGTTAPTHLLMVQKNSTKTELGLDDSMLIETLEKHNGQDKYFINEYINYNTDIYCGNKVSMGTNQYGKPHVSVSQSGAIEDISEQLSALLTHDLLTKFNRTAWIDLQESFANQKEKEKKTLTFLNAPVHKVSSNTAQLGLFDIPNETNTNRAIDYLNDLDKNQINPQTAKLISTLSPKANPQYEAVVLLTAKNRTNNHFQYKLYSNIAEIRPINKWLKVAELSNELNLINNQISGKY